LSKDIELEVETIRLSDPKLATFPYQGVVMVEDFEVSREREKRSIPAGSLWIPADQPSFEVAVQLFEPEAPDSIVRWGVVSSLFERKIYIGRDLLEQLANEMLTDEEVQCEWESALEDPEFARDPGARALDTCGGTGAHPTGTRPWVCFRSCGSWRLSISISSRGPSLDAIEPVRRSLGAPRARPPRFPQRRYHGANHGSYGHLGR